MSTENNAATIADLAVKASGASVVDGPDNRRFLLIPDGFAREEITDPHGLKPRKPSYVSQSVTLDTTDSLVAYVNRFAAANTVLFANIETNTIAALLDYHAVTPRGPEAEHVAHRATLTLPYAEEWRVWTEASGRLKPQLEFARFIEENGGDVAAPSGGELLDAMRDLQANRKVNFVKAVRTASDNENFEYTDETEMKSKGGIEVPTKFLLRIPVYFGEPTTELYAFLRWKLDDGRLHLGVALHRAEHVRQAVFKGIVGLVGEHTSCPVVFGKAS